MPTVQSNFLIGAREISTPLIMGGQQVPGPGRANPSAEAGEALPARYLIYIDADGTCALASAAAEGMEAIGFVKAAYAIGEMATYSVVGDIISGLTGLTPGAPYFMSVTPGQITPTPPLPADTGHVFLKIGTAMSATTLLFMPETAITM